MLDLEKRMGFPREYLNFTLWYLKAKGYVEVEDNSDYGLTAEGVDYLESHSSVNPAICELLTGASACTAPGPIAAERQGAPVALPQIEGEHDPASAPYRVCN